MADRSENTRRVANVARLSHDAGHTVIAAFISPLRASRDLARSLVPAAAAEPVEPQGLVLCSLLWYSPSHRRVASHLVEKADYSYALFFGHLAIEKLLKGLHAARVRKHAPRIHNLHRLARSANLEVDQDHADALITVTAFNLEARYPDMGRRFREKCTPEYTAQQMASIKELFGWLRSQIP